MEESNGRVTTSQLYDAIASLRSEMCDAMEKLSSRIDNLATNFPTRAGQNALLTALEAELHGKIGESQTDRKLLRADVDSLKERFPEVEKDLRFYKGGVVVVGVIAPIVTGLVVALVMHSLGA